MSYYKNDYSPNRFYKKPRNGGNKKTSVPPREYQFDDFLSDVGNQEIARLFGAGEARAKLKVGDPGDRTERDADKIADAVVKNRQTDDAALIQAKIELVNSRVSSPSNSNLPNLSGSGKPMDENLKAYFEPRFGVDLGNVRLHTDERANRLSEYIHARAFAVGNDITFAQGEYKPETEDGKKLIAHEIAHTMQGDGGTVRRQVEEGWLLRENGTIRFNDKKGLTVEYKDAEGKLKTETKKLTDTRSLSRSLMTYIGGRKEAEKLLTARYNYTHKDLEAKSDDDIAYLLMTTHGAGWNGTQYTQLENTAKKMWDKILLLSNMKDKSLAERLVFTASPATRKLVEDLEKKSKQKYEEQKLKEQKERESYKPENFFKQYPSAKDIYEEHKLGSKEISEEAHLNFMRQYKTLYDNLDKFKPIEWTETVKQDDGTTKSELHYATKCNVYYDYYLRSKGYGRVLAAIDSQVFSPELNKQGSAEYNPELFKRRNNPVNHLVEYEKKHGDDIEIFTDPKKALDLTNQGHDVGVVGWYFDDDDIDKKKSYTHYSIVAPSGNIFYKPKEKYDKTNEKPYKLFNIIKYPNVAVDREPGDGITKGLLLSQSGARSGLLNYGWAYNGVDSYIAYEKKDNYYHGIVFVLFKKK